MNLEEKINVFNRKSFLDDHCSNIEEKYISDNYYWKIEEILLKDMQKSELYSLKKEYKEILMKEDNKISLNIEKFILDFGVITALENVFLREYGRIFLGGSEIEVSKKVFNRFDTFYKLNHIKHKNGKYEKIDVNSISLLEIMNKYGVKIPKNLNQNIKCPFLGIHKDNTASFSIYQNTNSFYCFGCHSGGGVVQFVQYMENLENNKIAFKKLVNLIK